LIFIDIQKSIEAVSLEKNYKEYALAMKALSDETRVKIYDMLVNGELCACKILKEFSITQPTLSYHMKILCESGLVDSRRDGIWMRYCINKNSLVALTRFFDKISQIQNYNCIKIQIDID
jgi:ArsR family transcriptional regulator, arsenate/arsenite/antimonite-responsive transcriptional repressor